MVKHIKSQKVVPAARCLVLSPNYDPILISIDQQVYEEAEHVVQSTCNACTEMGRQLVKAKRHYKETQDYLLYSLASLLVERAADDIIAAEAAAVLAHARLYAAIISIDDKDEDREVYYIHPDVLEALALIPS